MSMTCRPTRLGPYLGRQLDFFKNSFSGGPREQCPVGKPICSHFGSLGAYLLVKNCWKNRLFHASRHFGAPPRTPISVKIQFFWPRIMSFQYGFTSTFNREDWPTVEGVTAVLSGLCHFSGQSSRVDDLPAGTLRPVS